MLVSDRRTQTPSKRFLSEDIVPAIQRLRLPFVGIFLSFCLITFRLYHIQVWRHQEFHHLAHRQIQRVSERMPLRGSILDRKNRTLALSLELQSCFADPSEVENPAMTAKTLAPLLNVSSQELLQKIRRKKSSFVWLARKLDPAVSAKIQALRLPGIGLKREEKRIYPHDGLAAQLLGTVGVDNQGLSGVEYSYDSVLCGGPIHETWERDARGRGLLETRVSQDEPRHVVLTIDKTIQYIAEQELDRAFRETKAHSAMAVVQDAHTGEILAMAHRPTISSWTDKGIPKELLKIPAISRIFEPGSTYKIVVSAAALEEGVVTPGEVFHCENGEYKIANLRIHDHERHGLLTFAQTMEYSSNIGMAKVGSRVGKEKLYTYSRAFGFGALTGIGLEGEASGILRSPSSWSGVSLSMISFGQEVGVTALQITNAFSAIANGGWLMEPQIVMNQTASIRQVISAKTAQILTEILEGVVKEGTGVAAQVPGYRVAGKTGTAQKIDPATRRYSPDKYIASFCGFLPADRPRVTIFVMLDEPQGVYWGGYCAGPVFSRLGLRVMHALNIAPAKEYPVLAKRPVTKG